MAVRVVVLLGLALIIGVGTIVFARKWISDQQGALQPQIVQVETTPENFVLVAQGDLQTGTLVGPESLRWQGWPTEDLPPSYIVQGQRGMEEFYGAVVRVPMAAGEPISDRKLVKPGERGFMAAVLTPGMRPVTIPISDTRAAAGFIFPGDHVDVILTHGGGDAGGGIVGETIFRDLRVLAIDQQLASPDGLPRVGKTATLEVTPREVEAFAVMVQMGTLSLSLRSLRPGAEENIAADQREELVAATAANGKGEVGEDVDKVPTVYSGEGSENAAASDEDLDEHAERRRDQTFTTTRDVSVLIGGGGSGGSVVVIRGNAAR